jgi:hypothetical protein
LLVIFVSVRVAVTPTIVPVGGAMVTVGATVQLPGPVVVVVVVVVVVGAAIVTVGAAVQVPVPPKVIPVTTPLVRVAVAVTVFGQAELRVTAGAVV